MNFLEPGTLMATSTNAQFVYLALCDELESIEHHRQLYHAGLVSWTHVSEVFVCLRERRFHKKGPRLAGMSPPTRKYVKVLRYNGEVGWMYRDQLVIVKKPKKTSK
jgi:hypothetical protein